MENMVGKAQNPHALATWPLSHGLRATACLIQSKHPADGGLLPSAGNALPRPTSFYIHPSHPSRRSPPSAGSGKLSFPGACLPSSWVPEKILLSWEIGFFSHPTPSPRLPKAHSRPCAAMSPLGQGTLTSSLPVSRSQVLSVLS